MNIGILKETAPGERRVAIVPAQAKTLAAAGHRVLVERGAGAAAGFSDALYEAAGAVLSSRGDALAADALLCVQVAGCHPESVPQDVEKLRSGQVLIGFCDPLADRVAIESLAARGVTLVSLELLPRITRAQSMDALSSMALLAGYKAVIWAAEALPKMFPLMMTAAGTLKPAKVFVVGAGVAGLQAIAVARRLGAVVEAFDVRPVAKSDVESLGAKFVELPLQVAGAQDSAQDKGGYATAQDEETLRRQRELMLKAVSAADVVITTAAVPGRPAPKLITREMVDAMQPGSVIVDLAAERGGNCEGTQPGQTVERNGVKILGPLNVPSTVPYHASQMYSKNISTLFTHLAPQGQWEWNTDDEIIRDTLVVREGKIVNSRLVG